MAETVQKIDEGTTHERILTLARSILKAEPGMVLGSGFRVGDTVLVYKFTVLGYQDFFVQVVTGDGEWIYGEKYETAGLTAHDVAEALADGAEAYFKRSTFEK
jgi:hypothetical protein